MSLRLDWWHLAATTGSSQRGENTSRSIVTETFAAGLAEYRRDFLLRRRGADAGVLVTESCLCLPPLGGSTGVVSLIGMGSGFVGEGVSAARLPDVGATSFLSGATSYNKSSLFCKIHIFVNTD